MVFDQASAYHIAAPPCRIEDDEEVDPGYQGSWQAGRRSRGQFINHISQKLAGPHDLRGPHREQGESHKGSACGILQMREGS
jgi:hypothetical protein